MLGLSGCRGDRALPYNAVAVGGANVHTQPLGRFDEMHLRPHECVLLVHGLCRSGSSMRSMAKAVQQAGYAVAIVDYPSRTASIEDLTEKYLAPIIEQQRAAGFSTIHFVTHSLGGIMVRQYLEGRSDVEHIGSIVMLGPPNYGSEVIDSIGGWVLTQWLNGPAGNQLGTGWGFAAA